MKYFGKMTLLFFIVIASCTGEAGDKNTTKVTNFPPAEHLTDTEILSEEFQVASFQIIDSLIILSTRKDTIFHVYNKKEQHITSFGRKGKGPTEFQRPPFLENIWKEGDTIKTLIYNEAKRRPVLINVSESIHEENLVGKELTFPTDLTQSFLSEIFYSGSNQYIGLYDDQYNKKLDERSGGFVYDTVADEYELFPLTYLTIEPYDPLGEMNLNGRRIVQTHNRKKLFTAMMHAPYVEAINTEDLAVTRFLIGNDIPRQEYKLEEFKNRELPDYFTDIYVTDQLIYLLESENSPLNSDAGQRIKVMDWSGNPVAQYEISDNYALDLLVVDEANTMFYGLSWDKDSIFRFEYDESS